MGRFLIWIICLYQRFLSPFLGENCRFYPTCSQYAIDALRAHGVIVGAGYALWRIARCQPFCKGGYDPVPAPRRSRLRGNDEMPTGSRSGQ